MMKETAILFGNRPLAAVPAMDINMEYLGNMIDEDIAIRLGFFIRDLHYVKISLSNDNLKKKTRTTGRIRATVQSIYKGRAGPSLSLSARVVRDLHNLTGAELIGDENFFKKLQSFSKTNLQEESGRDTRDISSAPNNELSASNRDTCIPNIKVTKSRTPNLKMKEVDRDTSDPLTGTGSSTNVSSISHHIKVPVPNAKNIAKMIEAHDGDNSSFYEDSDTSSYRSSQRDCSDCTEYSSCSSQEEDDPHHHMMRCTPHNVAHINRVRGRNRKLLQAAAFKISKEDCEAESARRAKLQKSPDEVLDECFPGGSKFAHQLSDRWAKEKARKDKLDEKKKLMKLKFGLTEKDFEMRKAARKFDSDSETFS